MEDHAHRPHRPSKEKKKHTGGKHYPSNCNIKLLTSAQTATQKHSVSQIQDALQNLLHDRMMYATTGRVLYVKDGADNGRSKKSDSMSRKSIESQKNLRHDWSQSLDLLGLERPLYSNPS